MRGFMQKLRNVLALGRLVDTDDSQPVQQLQLELKGGEGGQAPRLQNYGITSNAGDNGLSLVLKVNGHRIVVALDDPDNRPRDLAPGEVKVYHREGHYIHLLNGGQIIAKSPLEVLLDTPLTRTTGDLQVDGDASVAGNAAIGGTTTSQGDISTPARVVGSTGVSSGTQDLDTHTHTGDDGGSTSPPV